MPRIRRRQEEVRRRRDLIKWLAIGGVTFTAGYVLYKVYQVRRLANYFREAAPAFRQAILLFFNNDPKVRAYLEHITIRNPQDNGDFEVLSQDSSRSLTHVRHIPTGQSFAVHKTGLDHHTFLNAIDDAVFNIEVSKAPKPRILPAKEISLGLVSGVAVLYTLLPVAMGSYTFLDIQRGFVPQTLLTPESIRTLLSNLCIALIAFHSDQIWHGEFEPQHFVVSDISLADSTLIWGFHSPRNLPSEWDSTHDLKNMYDVIKKCLPVQELDLKAIDAIFNAKTLNAHAIVKNLSEMAKVKYESQKVAKVLATSDRLATLRPRKRQRLD